MLWPIVNSPKATPRHGGVFYGWRSNGTAQRRLCFRLLSGEDAQDLFVARLDGGGEFLDFPCVRARMGEDEVDVVAIVGVVDGDVFRFADDEMSAG